MPAGEPKDQRGDGPPGSGSSVRVHQPESDCISKWKVELRALANEIGLKISVCHFPPGTSKWNKIEHRMFCHITKNWSGEPLISHAVIVNLIGSTKTETGLRIKAKLDRKSYPKGIKVTDEELAMVNLKKHK